MTQSNPPPALRKGSLARKIGYIRAEQAYPEYGKTYYLRGTLVKVVGVEGAGGEPERRAHLSRPHAKVELENGTIVTTPLELTWGEILTNHGNAVNLEGKRVILAFRGEGKKAMWGGMVRLVATRSGGVPQDEDTQSQPYSCAVQNGIMSSDPQPRLAAHRSSEAEGEGRG